MSPIDPVDYTRLAYLTTAEAAAYVRAPSTNALLLWARRHRVPRCKRGHLVLFLRRDLDDALDPRHTLTLPRSARSRPVHSPDRGDR